MIPDELRSELDQQDAEDSPRTSAAAAAEEKPPQAVTAAERDADSKKEAVDDAYFDSYSYFDIHREMLADKVRTEAYRYDPLPFLLAMCFQSCCWTWTAGRTRSVGAGKRWRTTPS